jgi:hypothetical protein
MAGGLIEIVSYGTEDLFLTGTPQITHFKVIYRRHTNFSIESLQVDFEDEVGFGRRFTSTIPRNGDLMWKTYFQVILPEISIPRFETDRSFLPALNKAKENLDKTNAFMELNSAAYRNGYAEFVPENNETADPIVEAISQTFATWPNSDQIQADMLELLNNNENVFRSINMNEVVSLIPDDILLDKFVVKDEMDKILFRAGQVHKQFYDAYIAAREKNEDALNDFVKFAWVDKIGHAMIDYVEVEIGGTVIDKHYGDWIDIWHELTKQRELENNYKKMIGDVQVLTSFDKNAKPRYT